VVATMTVVVVEPRSVPLSAAAAAAAVVRRQNSTKHGRAHGTRMNVQIDGAMEIKM